MADALPRVPNSPLGELPDNPLGAPPAPPIVGKRQPLAFPFERLKGRGSGGGGRSSGAPLPNLLRKRKPQQPPTAPVVKQKKTPAPQAPIVIQPRQRTAPVAPSPAAAPQTPARRRTAAEARDEARGHLSAVLGPQIANHPLMGHADIRDRLSKFSSAHARGFLSRAHDAALGSAQADVEAAQRGNPGYKPRDPSDAGTASPEPGMPPEVRSKRAAQYAEMRATLDALRQKPNQPGGQP